ncbi:uncharacterized protein LOC132734976 isoform X2 [Ruditapes philippinarum]|uniref:uncharacterized protein LOC132734976 isoform X2 n=1 Tax=Ruditapes philippinarum TaxID=129788 RepID=UPI00295C33BA|nr:uncharacterized protein LOC132734976 isoform X2 [Ruditapes philippinarum]
MSGNEEGDGEYKDGPKDTIEVRGPENLINRYKLDLLQLYFESQKDLNGSITDISFDAANAVVVIKFDSEQAAQRITECPSHVLKGESLKIKLRQNPNFRARSAQTTHAGSIVRVSGLKRIEAKEIVEYYFENKRRSGGGPITSFVPVESDDDTYEITFENTKDATSVVQRPHIINGLSVDVALLHNDRETEYYKDRFLIKGLPKNTSDEYLLCFIKAVTGMKPKFLAFHKKEKDVVLVIMRCDLDVAQFIEHCKEETLEGVKIQIYEVEVSNVIHVSNLPENIHSDTILLYFENKRKSKGGTVKNVIRLDTASCLVYFENYKVIESVLSHAHVLQRRDIIVRKYFKCVAQTEEETFSTSIPPAVAIPDLDIRILKFIQQNEEFKHIVEQELLSHHAQIDWPKEGSDSCEVSINCIVDESKVLSNRVILRWEMEIREVFKSLMDKIYVHSITLIGEFNFDDSCVECTAGNEENTLVLLDRGECRITFLGTSPKLAATLCSQDNFSGDAEEELKVERVSLTHAVEFKMLRSLDYRDRIIKEVPNISMNENEENLGVDFEGYPLDVRNAKLLMLEMKNEYNIVFLYSLSALSSKLYSNSLTVDYVNKSLTSAGLDCIWKVSQQTLIICCLKKYDLETCIRVIKASVIDDVIHQHTNEVDICDMSLLETELHKLEAQYLGKVAISLEGDNEIYLCSTKDIRDVILKEIQEGMMKQSRCQVIEKYQLIRKQITSLKRIETRMLLADKFPTEMENLFPDLKVKINQNKNEICFEGPLGQVRDAEIRMYELKASFAVDRSWKISELAEGLLVLKQTKEHVVKKLKASRVTAVWDTVDGCLEVYCTSQDQIQLCVNVIRASVIEHTVALRKAAKTVVNSDKWQTKVDELHLYHAGKCMIKVSADSCKVQICATDDIVNEILDIVEICLRQNTVVEAKVPCTRNVHRLIERHHKNEISNIAKGLTNYNVQISSVPEYGGFEVRGTEDGLQQALQQLHQLLLKVKQKEHVMTKPGLSKHMQTLKGKDNLNTIESMHQCVVAVKGDYDEDEITDNPYDTVPKGKPQTFLKSRPPQKSTVSMTKGEIARQKAFENETKRWSSGRGGRQYDLYQDLQGRFDMLGDGEQDQSSRRQIIEKHAKNQDLNKVTFIILAMSEHIIDQAISKLESCLDKEITSNSFDDSIIMNLNDQQIMEIKNVAMKHHLDVKVDSSKGIIQISGISANVSKAADNIHRILRHAVTVEQEKKTAKLMINLVQWSYMENEDIGQTLKRYDKELNYKIESAYLSKADCVKFRADKVNYVLDFAKMEEYPEDDQTDTIIVIRRDLVKH